MKRVIDNVTYILRDGKLVCDETQLDLNGISDGFIVTRSDIKNFRFLSEREIVVFDEVINLREIAPLSDLRFRVMAVVHDQDEWKQVGILPISEMVRTRAKTVADGDGVTFTTLVMTIIDNQPGKEVSSIFTYLETSLLEVMADSLEEADPKKVFERFSTNLKREWMTYYCDEEQIEDIASYYFSMHYDRMRWLTTN